MKFAIPLAEGKLTAHFGPCPRSIAGGPSPANNGPRTMGKKQIEF